MNSLNSHGGDNIVAKMFSKMTLYFQSNDLISRANASKQTSDVWKGKADKVKAKVENGKQKIVFTLCKRIEAWLKWWTFYRCHFEIWFLE